MQKKDMVFWIFGIYFIALGIVAFINAFKTEGVVPLWFSYIAFLVIGLGILKKNSTFILTQLNIIMVPTIFWNIDFFYQFISGNPLWGATDYLFNGSLISSLDSFISIQHVIIIPIALAFIFYLGIGRKDLWKWSLIEAYFVFALSLIFSSAQRNFNCALSSCVDFVSLESPYYQFLWIVSVFLMIYLINYLVVRLARKEPAKESASN